ncbi:MAG: hypothetical protein FJX77_14085, partial [Armatimonadetes bacterium]|nr:hypothetical protein [Armatimonadota bacterium]
MEAPLRLLLVYPSCNLDVNPSLACLLEQFSARGAAVDVVMEEPGEFSTPVRHGPGVRFHPYPPGHVSLRGVRVRDLPLRLLRWVRRPGSGPQYRVWNDLAFFSATRAARYDAILGVDPGGIATAALLNRQARRPLLYLSYELLFRCELASPEEEAIKQAELAACRQVTLALIQDEERAALLAAETGLPRERMVLSPVAPAPTPRPASAYLRDRLAIPQDARTVLYLGQSSAWTGRDEMAEMVASWPERYVLVLHSSSR